ncbi:MAG: hypothetical protein AAGF31_13290 [Planctomycetota bacterium]
MNRRFGNPTSGRYTAGTDVLRLLASAAGAVQSQTAESGRELERVEAAAEEEVRNRSEQLMQLAEHYLPAISRDSVSGAFAEVRGQLQNVLRRKQQAEEDLQRRWDTALDRRQQLQTELDQVTGELDALVARRDELEEQLANRLEEDDPFQDLSRQALRTEQELERNLARVEESKQEAADKLPAYKRSRLFQ